MSELTVSEGDSAEFVVQKVGLFESDIQFELSGGVAGGGSFSPANPDPVTNLTFLYTAPENTIALEDDMSITIELTLLTPSPQILTVNTLLTIVVQDNDGEFIKYIATCAQV